MREFFELVCEYPWTTFFLFCGVCVLLNNLSELIHEHKQDIYINYDDDKRGDKEDSV